MECPYKIFRIITVDGKMESDPDLMVPGMAKKYVPGYKRILYQECAMSGCQMWSGTLQDCRLALSGMERVTQKSNGGGE